MNEVLNKHFVELKMNVSDAIEIAHIYVMH